MRKRLRAYLLFGVCTGTGPFGDDVLASFIVGRKGKSNAGEGGTKVNTHNELGLASIGTFDLGGVAILLCGARGHGETHTLGLLHAIGRRRVHLLRNTRLVLLLLHVW